MAEVEIQKATSGIEGMKIHVLSDMYVRIGRRGLHTCDKVLYPYNGIPRSKHALKKGNGIDPFPWGAAERSIVKIETVNVDDCPVRSAERARHTDGPARKSWGLQRRPRARQPKTPGK
jgi:hypothetical protein